MTQPTVGVFVASLSESREDVETALALCSDEERARAERFRQADDRARFALARGMLRRWCGMRLSCDPAGVTLATTAAGKVIVPGTPFAVSIAHGGDIVMMAAGTEGSGAIGVDVEPLVAERPFVQLAAEAFSSEECAALEAAVESERMSTFYTIWVRKEAALKAEGVGLSGPLRAFSVLRSHDGAAVWEHRIRVFPHGPEWTLRSVDVGAQHVAAIATSTRALISVNDCAELAAG
jgi:4'-phosphopantetheinyl transferase